MGLKKAMGKTGPILRNLIAYEQCNRSVKPYFTSYIIFFNGLMNKPEDIQILCKKRILIMFWAVTMKSMTFSIVSLRMLLMIGMSATFLH